MKFIKNENEYKDLFKTDSKCDCNKIKNAFETARDTRKFEIELYWKRATYFWAFIAASFAAFFVLLSSKNISDHKHLTIVISLIGYLFSLGWYLVNRGSKYWQENWEGHVTRLEDAIQGPLFKLIRIERSYNFWKLLRGYPYSVTKVNQFLSFLMTLFWLFAFMYSLAFSYNKIDWIKGLLKIESITYIFVIWIIILIGISLLLICFTRSFVIKESKALSVDNKDGWLCTGNGDTESPDESS